MKDELPAIVTNYVDSSNKHDVKAILACFAETATVHDEGQAHTGTQAIQSWIVGTVEQYKFQFKPLGVKEADKGIAVRMEVSGKFEGSPVTLDFLFTIESERILALRIK